VVWMWCKRAVALGKASWTSRIEMAVAPEGLHDLGSSLVNFGRTMWELLCLFVILLWRFDGCKGFWCGQIWVTAAD